MKLKLSIVATLVLWGAVAITPKPANAIVIARGACENHYATYYNLGWNGITKYISGCTN